MLDVGSLVIKSEINLNIQFEYTNFYKFNPTDFADFHSSYCGSLKKIPRMHKFFFKSIKNIRAFVAIITDLFSIICENLCYLWDFLSLYLSLSL